MLILWTYSYNTAGIDHLLSILQLSFHYYSDESLLHPFPNSRRYLHQIWYLCFYSLLTEGALRHKKVWLGLLEDAYTSSLQFLNSFYDDSFWYDLKEFFQIAGVSFLQGSSYAKKVCSAPGWLTRVFVFAYSHNIRILSAPALVMMSAGGDLCHEKHF